MNIFESLVLGVVLLGVGFTFKHPDEANSNNKKNPGCDPVVHVCDENGGARG